ncbi:MAG: DNA-binding protein [Atribacterota bacterium]|nr:DNA-binding protein [Atribacterota bacterium]
MISYFGNRTILEAHKTAFLCSRKCPSEIVIKSLDWAVEKKNTEQCVISGFHSRIEKDVFNILIKGKQPIILALARGMKKYWPLEIKNAVKQDRLLVISPFEQSITRTTQETANIRNKYMLQIADEIYIPYYTSNGNLDKLINNIRNNKILQ